MVEPTRLCDCDSEQCHAPFYNRLFHDGNECVHIDGTRHKIKTIPGLLRVRYKFKDDSEFITVTVTEKQYFNLHEVFAIDTCEILGSAQTPISKEEKEKFNQKILIVCSNDANRTKYLLQ